MRKAIKAFAHEAGAVLLFALALCASSALGAEAQKGVTKGEYLDLMEAAVGAYSDEHMARYLADVEKSGVQEHGFPRLAANLGVLVANGRLPERRDLFARMMTACCRDARKGMKASQKELKNATQVEQNLQEVREAVEAAENKAIETNQAVEKAVRTE